jgi:hypothetical protein
MSQSFTFPVFFQRPITISSIVGNISGSDNLRTSFNQGSATGAYSFAVGSGKAFGSYSHAEGSNTIASGLNSHAEGATCKALGDESHAEGRLTEALGNRSHAAGDRATALHNRTWIWSVPPNDGLIVTELSTTRAGQFMVNAPGGVCFYGGKVGIGTDSIDNALTVVGDISATGNIYGQGITGGGLDVSSLTNYLSTNNLKLSSTDVLGNLVVYGILSSVSAVSITNTFINNISSTSSLEVGGTLTVTQNISGFGLRNSFGAGAAFGDYSFAEGFGKAQGSYSHAEGNNTTASGNFGSHAEGNNTLASNLYSHAEGGTTIASGVASHAEGAGCEAIGNHSHAEGDYSKAIGEVSHAEGFSCYARGDYSHAAGWRSEAAHTNSWIWQGNTTASIRLSTTRANQFMVSADGGIAFYNRIGIGTDSIANALTVIGNVSATGTVFSSGAPVVVSTSTFETPTTGISAISNIVALSQASYNALTVKLPTTLYVII